MQVSKELVRETPSWVHLKGKHDISSLALLFLADNLLLIN